MHRDGVSGLATRALAEALVQAHFQACGGLGGIHTSSDSAAFGIGEGGSNSDARRASLRQMRQVLYSRSLLNILSYSHSKNYTTTTIEPNVQKFITHLKDVGHASMEDVDVDDILAQLRDVENHRVELLRRALVQTQTPLSHPNKLVSTLRPIGLNPQPSDQLVSTLRPIGLPPSPLPATCPQASALTNSTATGGAPAMITARPSSPVTP